jgi:MinD-like ATPase involved in chromosome partitioning or flagellar assembly
VDPDHLHEALEVQLKECLHRIVTLQSPEYEFRQTAEGYRPALGGRAAAKVESNGVNGMITGRFLDYLRQPYLESQIPGYFSDTEHENLKVLTAGSVTYELADNAFPILIDRLARSFDVVLLDCPPVAITSPTNLLSECADGVLMVVKAEGYDVRIIQQARDQLIKAGANIIGVILNHVNVSQDKAMSYYYGAYRL